ncbi:MAG: cell division protein ZipA [Gammaproteobacteria bacterium]|nr:MAG: cell division protein ZipA [Gammaproteobacteria bacterium]
MDGLRIILLIFGALVVAGIYVWETRRNKSAGEAEHDPDELPVDDANLRDDGFSDAWGDAADPMLESSGQTESFPKAVDLTALRDDHNGVELVVTISVMARDDEVFSGAELSEVRDRFGLSFGEMHIFHRFENGEPASDRKLFSVANAMEPGTFDNEGLENLATPGLCLFLRLPGPIDPQAAFEAMVDTAQGIAELLDAEIWDESHSALTPQSVNYLRERVADFTRRHAGDGA